MGRESPAKRLSGLDQWNGVFPPEIRAPIKEPLLEPEPMRRSLPLGCPGPRSREPAVARPPQGTSGGRGTWGGKQRC